MHAYKNDTQVYYCTATYNKKRWSFSGVNIYFSDRLSKIFLFEWWGTSLILQCQIEAKNTEKTVYKHSPSFTCLILIDGFCEGLLSLKWRDATRRRRGRHLLWIRDEIVGQNVVRQMSFGGRLLKLSRFRRWTVGQIFLRKKNVFQVF